MGDNDDNEIDILGDFSLDNFLLRNDSSIYGTSSLVSQNTELLNCDYTIHPQWLLDKPSTNPECWYNSTINESSDKTQDTIGHVSTENSISDESGWTEKEKNLLVRGIEIFGKNNVNLAQFIGSKTPSEVKYYLKNFYTETQSITHNDAIIEEMVNVNNLMSDIMDDTQIPASMEEIIASTTKSHTISPGNINRKTRKKDGNEVHTSVKQKKKQKHSPIKQKTTKIIQKLIPIRTDSEDEDNFQPNPINTDTDVDIEVDIENSDEDTPKIPTETVEEIKFDEKPPKIGINLDELNENLVKELTNTNVPTEELRLKPDEINDLEKIINYEFFEGRPTKTPARYLKIRNHILNAWTTSKPNYVMKTSIRQGLKNCGDVNCISRIHTFLEQIGAINFGCSRTNYIRPLYDLFGNNLTKEKSNNSLKNYSRTNQDPTSRARIKRKVLNDGEGGYTLTHNEFGEVINTTIVNEEPQKPKLIKRPFTRLIHCRTFDNNPFTVKLQLSTLLLMDFHAHTSYTEVMGLVAGRWDSTQNILRISHYEPCRNLASSATHCDMCPISQSKAAESIHQNGLDILGWFHSHPTFPPEPSQQDLDTQKSVQLWIGSNVPCLGVILTPFNPNGTMQASPFRCMIVRKLLDDYVPYKFNVGIITDRFDLNEFLSGLKNIQTFTDSQQDFMKPYIFDTSINCMKKYIGSVRMHLIKCGNLEKSFCERVIDTVMQLINL